MEMELAPQYVRRHHKHEPAEYQCTSSVAKHIKAPVDIEAEKMAANEYPKLEKLVVLLDTNGSKPLKNDTTSDKSATQLSEAPKKESSKEVQEDENGGRNSKDIRSGGDINGNNYVYRTFVCIG